MGSQLAAAEYQVAGVLKLAFREDRRKGPIQVLIIPMDSWLRQGFGMS